MNQFLGYILGGLCTLAAALITVRGSRRAAAESAAARKVIAEHNSRIEQIRVDREAYELADRITRGLVTQLTKEVGRLNVEVAGLRASNTTLESSNRSLEGYMRALFGVLESHNIPIPTRGS